MSASVLILGANGRFGRVATRAFAAAGWRVLAQARHPAPGLDSGSPANVEPLTAALDDQQTLSHRAAGVRSVVYAVNPPYTRWSTEALPAARLGMDLARRLDATFMLPGNVYNFGEQMPAMLEEDTPQLATTGKGRIRCEMEADLDARAAQGLRSVVVRAGDFYGGAGTGSWFDLAIVRSLRSGKLVYPGPMNVRHAWAYLPDLAGAFVAVAQAESHRASGGSAAGRAAARRLHFHGHTLTGAELLDAVERAAASLGIAAPGRLRRGSMPWGLIRAGGLIVPMWRELAEMAYLWRVPHALSGNRLERAIGPMPVTPVETAVRDALVALGFARA
ncbi:MAG: epimerase [Burkholderiales bacterium]|nr:MAG: epimerase [Burkholderiales bacterium]